MPEFHAVPDDDREAFHSLVSYAFRPEAGPVKDFDPKDVPTPATVGTRYGLYDGDDLLTTSKHIDFRTRIRGDFHDLHGLSAVASLPEPVPDFVGDILGSVRSFLDGGVEKLGAVVDHVTPE
ncbi:GNAT family N-acetyltransferase [Halobacterium sp. KA-4]|uniref:GNAT family N-acetyltransferase n=1 Tax=Halobacterium sp. KA-4 TaxID=2896367 RepID=UPI001E52DC6F|nr:GNAT family N-acetyltransferase [Halobacterium sp. KA-4]MCD2199364.1 GNAT family N-acetyltransferase [Halobacterium sp. KA-4]